MTDKYYSEDEVREIVRRAMEAQDGGSAKSDEGISIDELIEIGNEIGLDASDIKQAALDHARHDSSKISISDTHIYKEIEFESQLPEDEIWEEVLAELSHHFSSDTFGQVREHPRKYEWTHISISGIETVVNLVVRESKAKLRLSQRVGLASPLTEGITYGGLLSIVLIGIFYAIFNPGIIPGLAIGSVLWTLSALLVYKLDIAWRKKKLKSLRELGTKITSGIPSGSGEKTGRNKTKKKKQSSGRIHIFGADEHDGNDFSEGEETNRSSNKRNKER